MNIYTVYIYIISNIQLFRLGIMRIFLVFDIFISGYSAKIKVVWSNNMKKKQKKTKQIKKQ